MDAFFASVEQLDDPDLQGRPVVVGAPPDKRGVVSAASYEARKYGIHSAMPSREAYRRCPNAVFVPVNSARYRELSDEVFGIFERFTPFIEPLSIDEAFLDVTGARNLFGSGRRIAALIKEAIKKETGLTGSVGVAKNKFLAKLASDLEKPDGLVVVPEEEARIRSFLAPMPCSSIWGVGRVTRRCLESIGIRTIGDIQTADVERLAAVIGKGMAEHIKLLANGIDDRQIETDREEQSISREHTFLEDCSDISAVERVLTGLAGDVGRQVRHAEKYATVAHLKLRWKSFRTISRQKAFARPSCDDYTLKEMALRILRAENVNQPVRLVGFGVSGLQERGTRPVQLDFLDSETEELQARRENLSHVVDRIREKFGHESIGPAEGDLE
jgi:DNA polymerase-4